MAGGRPVRISILGDSKDFQTAMDRASNSAADFGKDIDKASAKVEKMENKFEGVGEGADTVASKGSQAAGALSGLGSTIGGTFGTAMVGAGSAMQFAADSGDLLNAAVEGGGKLLSKAKTAVTALTKSETYATAAKKAGAAAQWLLNAAMDANPVMLIVLAVAALVAGLVLFFTKTTLGKKIWQDFSDFIGKIVGGIKTFFTKDIPEAFQKVMDKAGAVKDWTVEKFQALVDWIKGLPGKIGTAAGDLFKSVKDKAGAAKDWVVNKFVSLVSWYTGLPGRIASAAGDLFKSVRDKAGALKDAVTGKVTDIVTGFKNLPSKIYNGIKAGASALGNAGGFIIDKLVSGLSGAAKWAGDIAGKIWAAMKGFINTNLIDKLNGALDFHISILGKSVGINLPNIPHLASGGITTGPTLALIGDNPGGREAVIPLDKYSMGGNTTVNVYVTAPVGSSPADIGRSLQKYLDAYVRAGGRRVAA